MKKNKAKAAAKVDALLAEAFTNDEARMQQIREQAHAELLRRTAEQPVKTKKKGLWRSVPALCALVIILIVAPIVAIIANPVSYSRANQFVRKATVWVNDTFKLDIELPVPEGENMALEVSDSVFTSVQKAADYIDKNLLVLDETVGCLIDNIEVNVVADGYYVLKINCRYKEREIMLLLESTMMEMVITPVNGAENIETTAGALWMWNSDGTQVAAGYIDEWTVHIYADLDHDTALSVFQTLKWLN